MRKYGMDVRILGLLVSSDYYTYSHNEYEQMQTSIGERCSNTIYKALEEKGFKVDFTATVYQIASELVRIAGNLMFGTELQFSNVKYLVDRDSGSLRVSVNACPICQYIQSDHVVCHVVSGFLAGLVQPFLSKFADVKVHSVETSCIARGDQFCSFDTRWRIPTGLPTLPVHEIEIRIDEKTVNEKVSEILATDFYQKAVAYARQRRTLAT
ncbi:V4R domain-containing protein [[Eubacterium] cellulosolvens]